MRKDLKLDATNFCYHSSDMDVYKVGTDRIRIFSTTDRFISESTCLKVSEISTQALLLPRYPVYQDGVYCGCATDWKKGDWISSFASKSIYLKRSLMRMRDEIVYLSSLGYDLVNMPFYCSFSNGRELTFDGTYYIQESPIPQEQLEKQNCDLLDEYISDLVYNAMSEFAIDSDLVCTYLYKQDRSSYNRIMEALTEGETDFAGNAIKKDIHRKVLR